MFNKSAKILLFFAIFINTALAIHFNNDDEVLDFVKKFLPKNPIILEAGGFDGADTKRMKSVWPESTSYVFEPLPNSFSKLVKIVADLPNVTLYPYALNSYSGKTHFYINVQNSGASSIGFPADFVANQFNKIPIEVQCITINDWASKYGIDHVDFIWLDIEGHELYALQASLNILDSVKAIYAEVDYVPIREGGCVYEDLKLFLLQQGFTEMWKSKIGIQGNALFVK